MLIVSLLLNLKTVKHRVGERAAKTPKPQIVLKIDPIKGFRQGTFPDSLGGKAVRIAIRSKPKNAKNVRKAMSKLLCWLEGIVYHDSE